MGTIRQIFVMMLLSLLSIQAAHVQARSWRVNSDETRKAHFTDINAAMASEEVVDGDTLYMDPGCTLTSNQTVTKQVTIVGCGYLRTDAPHGLPILPGICIFGRHISRLKV